MIYTVTSPSRHRKLSYADNLPNRSWDVSRGIPRFSKRDCDEAIARIHNQMEHNMARRCSLIISCAIRTSSQFFRHLSNRRRRCGWAHAWGTRLWRGQPYAVFNRREENCAAPSSLLAQWWECSRSQRQMETVQGRRSILAIWLVPRHRWTDEHGKWPSHDRRTTEARVDQMGRRDETASLALSTGNRLMDIWRS